MKRLGGNRAVLSLLVAAATAFAVPAALAQDQHQPGTQPGDHAKEHGKDKHKDAKKDGEKEKNKDAKGVKPGDAAPAITLKDTDNKEHSLSSETQGKIVVLQWFNPDCPVVGKYYKGNTKTFNELYTKYHDKGVEFFAINSGAKGQQGSGQDRNAKAKKDWEIQYPILLDESGDTGHAYGAKFTPTMVIIGKDGKVAYFGGVDDDSGDKTGKTNYVAKALDELLGNKPVTTKETKASGCTVKYAK